MSTFAQQGIDFVMNNPCIIAFPKGADQLIKRMAEISAEISQTPEYASGMKPGLCQPVLSCRHSESLELLGAMREYYMQYRDALQSLR